MWSGAMLSSSYFLCVPSMCQRMAGGAAQSVGPGGMELEKGGLSGLVAWT